MSFSEVPSLRTGLLSLAALALLVVGTGCSPQSDETASSGAASADSASLDRAPADAASADSAFEARMDSTLKQIKRFKDQGETARAESLQRARAPEFFEHHLNHPETKVGKKAGRDAFRMWKNIGADKRMEAAIGQMSRDSETIGRVLILVRIAYESAGRSDEFAELLQDLIPELTHPLSKASALLRLGRHHQKEGNRETAFRYYRRVVDLDAHPSLVDKALAWTNEMESLQVGQQAPGFKATTVDGDSLSLEDLRGTVVVLEFWATWCGPCIPQIPHLKALDSEHSSEELTVVGVALNSDADTLKQFVDRKKMTWPQIQQPKQYDGWLAEKYSVEGIPKVYVLDRTGTIAARDVRGEALEKEVQALVREGQG
jgi:peroxiredoxin